ncbi:MAG: isocitrate lyase/phosphoenolpyruvate mutase family protein [Bacteroidota bacterium]
MTFKALHYQDKPLLIANVWDIPSTKTAEKLSFHAIGTSSAAIATVLGYQDGENMPFDELAYMVNRISSNSTLPLSVDIESGYSRDPEEITTHIVQLSKLGVVGVNIEDSCVVNGQRTLQDAEEFAHTLSVVRESLMKKKLDIFLNVRSDTFIVPQQNTIIETQRRIKLYENAGADGIFIPCVQTAKDIQQITGATNLPVNVMCMPNLPDFDALATLGVKRISMGNFIFEHMYGQFTETMRSITIQRSFKPIF